MTPDPDRDRAAPRVDGIDLDALLHPARAFRQPSQVVTDPDLTLNEKRAILASWASDVCAIEAAPDLRAAPAGPPVRFDDIMEALKSLDREASLGDDSRRWRRVVRRRRLFDRRPPGAASARGYGRQ